MCRFKDAYVAAEEPYVRGFVALGACRSQGYIYLLLSAPSLTTFCCLFNLTISQPNPPINKTTTPLETVKMFTSSRRDKSYRDSFSYRAGKQTSKKKERSFREKDLSQSRRAAAQPQTSPTKSQTSSAPTSP